MKTSLKVFLACALGAIIGLIVALSINDSSFFACLIGMVIGGLFGYLAYDFKQVIAAIKIAWRQVIHYKPSKQNWKGRMLTMACVGTLVSTVLIGFALITTIIVLLIAAFGGPFSFKGLLHSMHNLSLAGAGAMAAALIFFPLMFQITVGSAFFGSSKEQSDLKKMIRLGNPLQVYFITVPKGIFKSILDTAKTLHKLSVLLFKFVKKVFVLIHSDERLICMSYAAAGVLIGYIIPGGSILKLFIGAIVSGATGFAAYELLFKKKLETAKQQEA